MGKAKNDNKPCKWCLAGECWNHGQIEKPANAPEPKRQAKTSTKKKTKKTGGLTKQTQAKMQPNMQMMQMQMPMQMQPNMMMQMQPNMQMMMPGTGGKKKKNKGTPKPCKWCAVGQCWGCSNTNPGGMSMGKGMMPMGKGMGNGMMPMGKGMGKGMMPMGKGMMAMNMGAKLAQNAKNVKAQAQGNNEKNGKVLLVEALPLLLGRNPTKEDTIYTTMEDNGQWTCLLQIPGIVAETTTFQGKAAESKKEAENNACRKVVSMLGKQIKEAKAAHAAVKAEKQKLKDAEWQAKKEMSAAVAAASAAGV